MKNINEIVKKCKGICKVCNQQQECKEILKRNKIENQ